MSEERLQKVLAQAGVDSRRACEELILAGRVTVDGRVVTEPGIRVDPAVADIRVDGQPITAERHRYIVLHKPAGYLSGPDPRADYPSWEKLVKVPERLYAVGRLDHDSEGLLLLTNDGELALRMTHPRYEHPKTYLVQVEGFPNPRKIRRLQHGVMLEDGRTLPARVVVVRESLAELGFRIAQAVPRGAGDTGRRAAQARPSERSGARYPGTRSADGSRAVAPVPQSRTSWLKVTLREGRKRQLRRMVGLLGHPALRVIRVGLGPLNLGELRAGKWRDLTPGEVKALREAAWRGPVAGAGSTGEERKHRSLIPNTIAIDGPSASGKSTIGGLLASALGYLYFDTGVMYRAVAAIALDRAIPVADEAAIAALAGQVCIEVLPPTVADGRDVTVLADGQDISWDIRRPEVEKAVSPVSAYRGVREALRLQQRRIGAQGRVVMVGRDIGTAVLPDAELKIYLDASLAERARRRFLQRKARGEEVEFERVMQDVRRRDEYDSTRQHSPLAAAPDAIVVDTTGLNVEQVLARVRGLVKRSS